MNTNKKNLAVFVSGSGTNFIAIQEFILDNNVNGKIVLLISSKPDALALSKAERYSIDYCVIQQKSFNNFEDYANEMHNKLKQYNVDYIILAGFLKKIPLKIIQVYKYHIINIHPALLPKFGGKGMYGIHVHEAVLKAGETETGPTVHFVDEIYDNGAIIMQKKVPIKPDDTPEVLQKRVLEYEHKILPRVVQLICDDKIKINNNKVIIEE